MKVVLNLLLSDLARVILVAVASNYDPKDITDLWAGRIFNCDSLAHMLSERPLFSYLQFEDVLFRDMVMGSGLYNDPLLAAEELWKDDPDYYYVRTGREEPEDDFALMRRWTNLLHADHFAYYRGVMRQELQRVKARERRIRLEAKLTAGEVVNSAEYMRCVMDSTIPSQNMYVDGQTGGVSSDLQAQATEFLTYTSNAATVVNTNSEFYYTEAGEKRAMRKQICEPAEDEVFIWHRDTADDEIDGVSADWRLEFVQHLKRLSPLTAWTNMQCPSMMELLSQDLESSQRKSRLSPTDPRMRDVSVVEKQLGADAHLALLTDGVCWNVIESVLLLLAKHLPFIFLGHGFYELTRERNYRSLDEGAVVSYMEKIALKIFLLTRLHAHMNDLGKLEKVQKRMYHQHHMQYFMLFPPQSSAGNEGKLPLVQFSPVRGLSPLLLRPLFASLAHIAKRKRQRRFRRCLLASILDIDLKKVAAATEERVAKEQRTQSRNQRRYKGAQFAAWESRSMAGRSDYNVQDAPTETIQWSQFIETPEWALLDGYPDSVREILRQARFINYDVCARAPTEEAIEKAKSDWGLEEHIRDSCKRLDGGSARLQQHWKAFVLREPLALAEPDVAAIRSAAAQHIGEAAVDMVFPALRLGANAPAEAAVSTDDSELEKRERRSIEDVGLFLHFVHERLLSAVSNAATSDVLEPKAEDAAVQQAGNIVLRLLEVFVAGSKGAPISPNLDADTPASLLEELGAIAPDLEFQEADRTTAAGSFIVNDTHGIRGHHQHALSSSRHSPKFVALLETPIFPFLDNSFRAVRMQNVKIPNANITLPYRHTQPKKEFSGVLPAFYVLQERDLIADHVRKLQVVDCPVAILEALQKFPVDFFFEVGGYFGDCVASAAYLRLAKRGVFNVDGSSAAIQALQKTFRALRAEGGMKHFAKPSAAPSADEEEARKDDKDYVLHSEAHFVSDKNGFFRRTDSGTGSAGPNALTAAAWEPCDPSGDASSKTVGCDTSFVTVDALLARFFGQVVPQSLMEGSTTTPRTVAIRIKVSGADDEVVRGMLGSLSLTSPFTVKWLHIHIVPWCSIHNHKDCVREIKERIAEYGFAVHTETMSRPQYSAAKMADILAVRTEQAA
ncbi:unnamed protein product [Amoebophrya sp. A120]|nr:unnamed protein product [Amoebophrya sp. A120]|eukprot:GSA120T00005516001.1